MTGTAASIAALDIPLPEKLQLLREASRDVFRPPGLWNWGERHLSLTGHALCDWGQRAWWGLAAGELLRSYLYDEHLWHAALELIDPPGWREIDAAQQRGGVILAAAHIGPPKFAMNHLIDRNIPLLIWTNTKDMPGWLPTKPGAKFIDPLFAEERAVLLVKSAIHLREGGMLFGAPDWPSGTRTITLQRYGIDWKFSLGVPTLARRLGLPAFLVIALWHSNRIRIECTPITPPDVHLPNNLWQRVWLERYWGEIEKIIPSSPENLRFLRGAYGGL